ncbi:hypothetical protein [Desulfurivibrio alkaliphilus]|uniref:RNA polymerase II-associated protein n=1 Tax=Desulfurivibrio alkaliphilus (strain DSM 19089 / UNIQEM U267 / AHT2) TaxID=589865 RepID=D6Z3C7_DESAT|nr:hypothetical protein [Desulfurivibrio alkaliphilus]ADH86052.1 RNA polymerase II-associated protein [Desulfurivibrio alkaliphilus AHT 2]
MELICEKYREKMPEDEAYCRRPNEYCKFRTACIIHFVGQERRRGAAAGQSAANRPKKATNSE